MGKERKYKLLGLGNRHDPYDLNGAISRDDLSEIVKEAFESSPKEIQDELQLLVETVEYIGYGYWQGWVMDPAKGEEPQRCGCPLASISDWIEGNSLFAIHPGVPPDQITLAFGRFDSIMSVKYPGTRHLKVI